MRAEHPDASRVRALIADLTTWLDIDVHDPTSQVTGGGAVRSAEEAFSELHGGRRSLLLPSATYAMRSALVAAGVRPRQRVLIPAMDWVATLAAVRAIGATPVPVGVDPATMTVDPQSVREHLDRNVAAIVACHLHGVPADIPAIRGFVDGAIPIIEDCAQSLGSSIDGEVCGTRGDYAVFSFAKKAIDVGEAAMVTSADLGLHHRLLEVTAHPVRQILEGIPSPSLAEFSMRVAPACAMQLAVDLRRWDRRSAVVHHAALRALLSPAMEARILGGDIRRVNASSSIPLRLAGTDNRDGLTAWAPSSALHIPSVIADGTCGSADVILVRGSSEAALT